MIKAKELGIFGENSVFVEIDGQLVEVCYFRPTDDGKLVLTLENRQ